MFWSKWKRWRQKWKRRRQEDQQPQVWTESGRLRHHGETEAGFESPDSVMGRAVDLGVRAGDARLTTQEARGNTAAANQHVTGLGKVRKALWDRQEAAEAAPLRVRKAVAKDKSVVAGKRIPYRREQLKRLGDQPAKAQAMLAEAKEAHARACKTYEQLPRLLRGVLHSKLVLGVIGIAVVVFDAAVIHAAMERAGMGEMVSWLTTVTVPGLIWAFNHALGLALGAVMGDMSERGRQVALRVWLLATLLVAVVGFVMLGVFRDAAVTSANQALAAIASGRSGGSLSYFVSPGWLGPFQIAGSLAAIVAGALYCLGDDGRKARAAVVAADIAVRGAEAEVAAVDKEIEQAHFAIEEADTGVELALIDGRSAEEELAAVKAGWDAERRGEDALVEAAIARQEFEYMDRHRLMQNGNCRLCEVPDSEPRWLRRWRKAVRHPAARREVALDLLGSPSGEQRSNGHSPVSSGDLADLINQTTTK